MTTFICRYCFDLILNFITMMILLLSQVENYCRFVWSFLRRIYLSLLALALATQVFKYYAYANDESGPMGVIPSIPKYVSKHHQGKA